ncbi:MAG: SMC-Scp complex subunit ScpB [Anaerolineae bacterium]|jgi:segregation and condensation protein B
MTTDHGSPEPLSLAAIVESLLFVADAPVTVSQLAEAIEHDVRDVEDALQSLAESYLNRGVRLQRKGNQVQLVSAPEAAPYIERFLGLSLSGKLSAAALETLAIIAYKQPITRPQIDAIRGVSSDGVLRTLVSKGLIEEVGRLESVGHPVLFGTTFEFLQYFGLSSLSELPALEIEPVDPHEEKGGES